MSATARAFLHYANCYRQSGSFSDFHAARRFAAYLIGGYVWSGDYDCDEPRI